MPKGTAAVAYHWSYREKTRQPEQSHRRPGSGRIFSERRISGGTQAAGCLCQTLLQNCTARAAPFFKQVQPKTKIWAADRKRRYLGLRSLPRKRRNGPVIFVKRTPCYELANPSVAFA